MFIVKKVFFNQTVHWAGLGPITEITGDQFHDAMWVENMPGFAFEHASGEITWVPASNIRWVQALIGDPEDHDVSPSSSLDAELASPSDSVNHPAPRKRGRPKKTDIH